MRRFRLTLGFLIAILVTARAPLVLAQHERAVGATPPRLAFVDHDVSYWRPGAEDWVPAQINTPLAAGDELYVGDGGNVEVQIGGRAYVRAGSGTRIGIDSLETGYLQLEVTSGHCAVDLKRLTEGQVIEVDTPHGAFTIERAGYYHVDVGDNTTFITRRGGVVTVVPAGGETTDVGPDQQVVLEGTDNVTVATYAAPDADDWDRWNFDRTSHLAERPRSAEYVAAPVAGADDLDAYGEWRETPRYGEVWVPRDVAPDWAPYSTGRWTYDPSYDWTWVDDAPWGWAPYHYGRWCYVDGYWGWAPGPVIAAPVYAPALVAFFGGGGVSVSVGTPFVSWVALGWGEPVLPWWGPPGFVGHAYWGGWGGPRVVNNTVINNTTIVNVTNINRFSNMEVRNAVVGVNREQFGRGRAEHVRIAPEQARQLQPLRGNLGVRPVAASLVPRAEHAARPPDQIRNRRVVATRPPQDPSPRLRAAGIETRGPVRTVAPRVQQPTRGHGAGERRGAERSTAPPPPGVGGRGPGERGRPGEPGAAGERGGPAERGPGERGGRGHAIERGAPNERAPGVERGREAAPPPPGAGAPEERGGRNVERGRHGAPPPPPSGVERGGPAERGAPNERGGPPGERGGRGHGIDRGVPNERGPGIERGREAVPPPPGAGAAPPEERGGRNLERGRHGAPPPPPPGAPPPPPPGVERGGPAGRGGAAGERGPNAERGRPRVERGREEAPPPPPRAPMTNEPRGGGSGGGVERGRHGQPAPERAPMMMNERGGGNAERGRRSAESQPPRQPPPVAAPPPAMREMPAPRGHGGSDRPDRGAPPPPRERPVAREQARPQPAPAPPPARGAPPPNRGGGAPPPSGGKHAPPDDRHGRERPEP